MGARPILSRATTPNSELKAPKPASQLLISRLGVCYKDLGIHNTNGIKAMKHALTAFFFAVLSACMQPVTVNAPADFNPSAISPVDTLKEWIQLPETGSRNTARLGDPLTSLNRITGNDEIYINKPVPLTAKTAKAIEMTGVCQLSTLPAGRYVAMSQSPNHTYYFLVPPNTADVTDNKMVMLQQIKCEVNNGYGLIGVAKNKLDGKITPWAHSLWNTQSPTLSPNQLEDKFVAVSSDPSFKQELYYNGKSGSEVKLLYREFAGNMLRASFSQEITYDLSEGSEVGFKDARLKIISASNTSITYEVLEHFKPIE